MRSLYAKAALILATTAIGVTMFAAVAFAAPTLDAGEFTGGPHDSRGNCASCHDYKAAPTPKPAPAPAPAPATPPAVTAPSTATPPTAVTLPSGSGSYTIIINIGTSGTPVVTAQPTAPVVTATPLPPTNSYDVDDDDDDDEGDDD